MQQNSNFSSLSTFALNQVPQVQIHGRTVLQADGSVPLFWTGSSIELSFKGTSLYATLEANFDTYEPWIVIIINGAVVARQALAKGVQTICLCSGRNPDKITHVILRKETQAMSADSNHVLIVKNLLCPPNTVFCKTNERPFKIEFIGDSITTGEGLCGAVQEEEWLSAWMSTINNYAFLIADSLNADVRILSQSGWGITRSWDNNPNCALPNFYEMVCGVESGDLQKKLGAQQKHDFSTWQADVVLVNLGTNDNGAFYQDAWIDPVTKNEHKLRLKDEGTACEQDAKLIADGVYNFLQMLRKNNAKSYIVWVCGMITAPIVQKIIASTIDDYKAQSNDERVKFVQLASMDEETDEEKGSRYHPGPGTHKRAAQTLIPVLQKILS